MLQYPPTRRTDVAQQFATANGGCSRSPPSLVSVPNPYNWLEDEDSAETKTFVAEQNESLNRYLLTDSSEAVKTRLMTLLRSQVQGEEISQPPESAGQYYLLRVSGCGRPFPITFKFKKSDLRKLLQRSPGPVEDDPETKEGIIHSFHDEASSGGGKLLSSGVSGRGKYWAYCTSIKGSDWGIIRVKEVDTGRELEEEIRDTKFNNARKPITWLGDSGFFYQSWQFSGKQATHPQLRYHALGTCQADDVLLYEQKSNPGRCFWLNLTADGKFAILSVYGSGQECQILASRLQITEGRPVLDFTLQICDNFDYKWEYIGCVLRGDKQLYIFLTDRNNGEIVGFPLDGSTTGATLLVQGIEQQTLKLAQVIGDYSILLIRSKDVCDQIQIFSTVNGQASTIDAPIAAVFDVRYSSATQDIFLIASSFSQPFSLWHIDGEKAPGAACENCDQPQLVKLHPTLVKSAVGVSSTQVFYTSADGTRVPMFLLSNDSYAMTEDTPILLYVYGGFGISVIPHFRPDFLVFIKAFRGVVAIANIRGGGEYGQSWYRAACKEHRQKVFDDIQGALKHLANSFGTQRSPILMGESMGALNSMSAIVQQPSLVSAALLNAGPFDILHRKMSGLGLRGVEDIGDETDPVQFAHIYKWSPLENVRQGQQYPPVLLTAGDQDDLVKCANSCKMVATLQHAQRLLESNPAVHLRVMRNLGHGGAVSAATQAVMSVERCLWLAITLELRVYDLEK